MVLALAMSLATAGAPAASPASLAGPCFDFRGPVEEPLTPPVPMLAGRDNHLFGTYPSGIGWAAGRVVIGLPIEAVYAGLLDHRNVKDMTRTTLSTRVLDRQGYLAFHLVDIVVTVRALFFKLAIPWTEAWGFRLVDGSAQAPRRIVVSYQKVAGTDHIQRECGSYVLQALDESSTDVSLYEEVKADRRSPRDTRDMHRGIVRNLRASRRSAKGAPAR